MLGSIIGGLVGGAADAYATYRANQANLAWEREKAKNYHQYEVEDLKAAGLNPILSADSHTTLGSANQQPITSGTADKINSALEIKRRKNELEMQKPGVVKAKQDAEFLQSAAGKRLIALRNTPTQPLHTSVIGGINGLLDSANSAISKKIEKTNKIDEAINPLNQYTLFKMPKPTKLIMRKPTL